MIKFRRGQTEGDAPVVIKAHRQGAHVIVNEAMFSEEQVAALNCGMTGWLSIADVWQLWHGEIVDLSEVGPEPQLKTREPAR
ncbi:MULTISPECIES: hypothetical protein [Streptomyces]|uniref:hypothetical protein n=1 Tax=Streptomyces TaxID=1883 RepID=UPI0029A39E44|nr:hypothetical protein [Streptomyces stelliscabiei]MDX2520535.1 hypothetical protein [Streptomyces stelliscabiei]MDX2552633.1 hypothetical protein [Streptomyces stelliscabiei]MDX2661317.1 hypothetical protein [Streptomyces stelliscabiei]MDX2788798.1 hypothetical protein [Streptomyces stelliscabiei]